MKKEVLRMEHVTVRHAGRNVLEDFHLNIYEGEFLFVYGYPDSGIRELGEIMKGVRSVQYGRFYAGESEIPAVSFDNPGSFGLYLVQNENNLVEGFTVAENLFFGGNRRFFGRVVPKKQYEMMTRRLLEEFGMETMFDPSGKIGNMPYEEQILLKLMMAYAHNAKLVVLDRIMGFDLERKDRLLEKTLRKLLNKGTAVMWMNQRMDAAWNMADRVLLMQGGRNVRTIFKGYEGEPDNLLRHAMESGISISQSVSESRNTVRSTEVIFEIDKLSSPLFKDMSLRVHKGEIVSICSMNSLLMANWRNIVTGMENDYSGEMTLNGRTFRPKSYTECMEQGVCFLDLMWYERHGNPDMSIEDNMLMPLYWRRKKLHGIISKGLREHARYLYREKYPGWPENYWWKLTSDQQKALQMERLCVDHHSLVIITEPFFQLHNTMLEDFYRLIRRVRDYNGAMILMAAIDKDVRPVSDRTLFLDQWVR